MLRNGLLAFAILIGVISGITTLLEFKKALERHQLEQASLQMPDKSIEAASWLLILDPTEDQINQHLAKVDIKERDLATLVTDFAKARKASTDDLKQFIKMQEPKALSYFCASGKPERDCQSAKLVFHILKKEERKPGAFVKALPALKFIGKLQTLTKMKDQEEFFKRSEEKYRGQATPFEIIKLKHANFLKQASEFEKASQLLQDYSSRNVASVVTTDPLGYFKFTIYCQSRWMTTCKLDTDPICSQDPTTKSWSTGCAMKNPPAENEDVMVLLGYWWNQVSKNERIQDPNSWQIARARIQAALKIQQASKNQMATITKAGLTRSTFAQDIFYAIDFAVSVKAPSPRQLLSKAEKIREESPFWAWSQKQALNRFGTQWAYLVNPSEQERLAWFDLFKKQTHRSVASEE